MCTYIPVITTIGKKHTEYSILFIVSDFLKMFTFLVCKTWQTMGHEKFNVVILCKYVALVIDTLSKHSQLPTHNFQEKNI